MSSKQPERDKPQSPKPQPAPAPAPGGPSRPNPPLDPQDDPGHIDPPGKKL